MLPYMTSAPFFFGTFLTIKDEKNLINTMWKKQTKIGFDKNVLVVADTSASMYGTPFETAISLAIYISQNNKSEEWRNKFVIFSSDCIEYSYNKNAEFTDIIDEIPLIVDNTDIDKVFTKILNDSLEKNLPQLDEVIIISDMEFDAVQDKKIVDYAVEELTAITGQKAVGTISKKDEASFKLRRGVPIGAKVTLRADRMYEFLDRLTSSALPRIRDFSGIKADGFDGRGNYNLGITEQIIFPEIVIDKVKKIQGMDITFVTSAKTDKEAKVLLTHFGLPFKKN